MTTTLFINKDSTYYGNLFESEAQMKAKLKSENFGDIVKNVLANSVQLAALKNCLGILKETDKTNFIQKQLNFVKDEEFKLGNLILGF